MNLSFLVLLPVVFWFFIVMLVIAVSKPRRRSSSTSRGGLGSQRHLSGTSGRFTSRESSKSFERPKMREGLFDIKLGKSTQKKEKQGIFTNTGFDDYSVIGRKKDFVSGYDKKYAKGSVWMRQSTAKQYSHTYDGHEPWDKCLPKEKDPWDKDFYT